MLFWAGIGLGFIFSLAASIVANIYSAKVNKFLENRKFKSKRRSIAKEIVTFQQVSALVDGTKDKYIFFIYRAMAAIIAITFFAISVLSFLIIAIGKRCDINPIYDVPYFENTSRQCAIDWGLSLFLAIAAFITAFLVVIRVGEFIVYWRRVDQFNEYRAFVFNLKKEVEGEEPKTVGKR